MSVHYLHDDVILCQRRRIADVWAGAFRHEERMLYNILMKGAFNLKLRIIRFTDILTVYHFKKYFLFTFNRLPT